MTGYGFGEVLLVPFPFTNQSTSKCRPAIVVSSDAYHLRFVSRSIADLLHTIGRKQDDEFYVGGKMGFTKRLLTVKHDP